MVNNMCDNRRTRSPRRGLPSSHVSPEAESVTSVRSRATFPLEGDPLDACLVPQAPFPPRVTAALRTQAPSRPPPSPCLRAPAGGSWGDREVLGAAGWS